MKDSPVMMIFLALLAVAGTLGGVWLGRYLEHIPVTFTHILHARNSCCIPVD